MSELICFHCGGERKQAPGDPVPFCNTPQCSGNPYGGTDDGQIDEQPTTVMDSAADQPTEPYQAFGERVVQKAVEKGVHSIEPQEVVHPDPETAIPYVEMNLKITYVVSPDDDRYDEICLYLQNLESDGLIGLLRSSFKRTALTKGNQ